MTAAEAQALASAVATKVDGITSLTLNGDALASSLRDDQSPSGSFTPGIGDPVEGLEIYIYGCEYKSQSYLPPSGADSVDDCLSLVNSTLDTLGGLEYSSCIAVSSCNQNGNTHIFIGLSQASYNVGKYLDSAGANILRTNIINALDSIAANFTYSTVQIICSRHDNNPSDNY